VFRYLPTYVVNGRGEEGGLSLRSLALCAPLPRCLRPHAPCAAPVRCLPSPPRPRPAPVCRPTLLAVTLINVSAVPVGAPGSRPRHHVYHELSLELHAKYPAPVELGPAPGSHASGDGDGAARQCAQRGSLWRQGERAAGTCIRHWSSCGLW
jgi:hypothetical protein